MAPLIIQLLLVLTLIPVVGYTVFSYQRSSEIVSLAQRNTARMDQISYAIRASLRPIDMNGHVRAPMGDANGNRMAVPSWIVSDDRTPWGARYGYCPYSVDATGSAVPANLATTWGTVGTGASVGGTYKVTIAQSRGHGYVLQSDNQPISVKDANGNVTGTSSVAQEEVVGFIMSTPPFVGDSEAPSCTDVVKYNGSWIVSATGSNHAGTVVPILSRGIGTGQVANQGEVVLYADSSSAAGDTGDTPAMALGFKDVLDLWHLTPWKASSFLIQGGPYAFSQADNVPGGSVPRLAFATGFPGRSLALGSSNGGQVVLQNSGSGLIELLLTVDTTLDHVSLDTGVQLRVTNGARVTVTNGNLRHVRVDGGDLTLGQGASVTGDTVANPNFGVVVTSGRLRLTGGGVPVVAGGASAAGIYVSGGDLVLDGTNLDVSGLPNGARTVMVLEGARVSVAPTPAGAMPQVLVNGVAKGVLGAETSVVNECTDGTDSCVASCILQGEQANVLRSAMGGGCYADEPFLENSETTPRPEERPALWRSGRGDLFSKSDANASIWVCQWKPGERFATTTVVGTSFSTYQGNAAFPTRRASARCVPNPSLRATGP